MPLKGTEKWSAHLKTVYDEMKAKDPKVRLKDAMKVAKLSYKK